MFDIRNKVAHCNYVFRKDLEQVQELTLELEQMFADAESKIDEAILSKIELQAITKAISEVVQQEASAQTAEESESEDEVSYVGPNSSSFENTFLRELEYFESEMKKPNWDFIALSKFLDYLEIRGYNRHLAASVARILDDKKRIAIEYQDNPHGFYKVASVRILES